VALLIGCNSSPTRPEDTFSTPTPSISANPPQSIEEFNDRVLERSQAYAAENGIEQLWDFVDAEKVIDFYGVSDDGSKVLYEETAYAPNGEKVPSGKFVFTDLTTGTQTTLNDSEEAYFYTASVSPDGKWVTAATFSPSSRLVVFDTQSLSSTPRSVSLDEETSPRVGRMLWHPRSSRVAFTKHNTNAPAGADIATLSFNNAIAIQSSNDLKLTTVYEDVNPEVVMDWEEEAVKLDSENAFTNAIQLQSWRRRNCFDNVLPGLPRAGNSLRMKLPFESGRTRVSQDYCGTSSHGGHPTLFNGWGRIALDFTAQPANTSISNLNDPVLAVASGTVSYVQDYNSSRCDSALNYVAIEHANGYVSYYLHLNGGIPVSEGQRVSMGDPIGEVGCTGDSMPHLHFHMFQNGNRAIPEPIDGRSNLHLPLNDESPSAYLWVTSTNQSAGPAPRLEGLHIRVGSGSFTNYSRNMEIARRTPIEIEATITNPNQSSSTNYYYVVALRDGDYVYPIWDNNRLRGRYFLRAGQEDSRIEVGDKDEITSRAGSGYALALYYGDSPDLSNFPNGFTQFDADKSIRIVEPSSGVAEVTGVGRVLSASDGSRISDVTVELFRDRGASRPIATTRTLSNGIFVFRNVPADDYHIVLSKRGFETLRTIRSFNNPTNDLGNFELTPLSGGGSGGTNDLPEPVVTLPPPRNYGRDDRHVIILFRDTADPFIRAPYYQVYWSSSRNFSDASVLGGSSRYFEGRYIGVVQRLSSFYRGTTLCYWATAHERPSRSPRSRLIGPECTSFPVPSRRSRSLDGGSDELILPDNLELFEFDISE
jgi:murein DD-endopeptidase MepM/ murein hydrolase activator NlpD